MFFNGTNVFLYPEGRRFDFPATVTVRTETDWLVATGHDRRPRHAGAYREGNYHDLVDMPFFVGRFDYDSMQVDGHVDPARHVPGRRARRAQRAAQLWDQIEKMSPPMVGGVPGDAVEDTTRSCMIFDSSYGGRSALEHTNSHVGIYTPRFIGNPLLASITAHEIFHALEREAAAAGRPVCRTATTGRSRRPGSG